MLPPASIRQGKLFNRVLHSGGGGVDLEAIERMEPLGRIPIPLDWMPRP